MIQSAENRKRLRVFLEGLFIYTWLTNLAQTDAYFSVYVLCAAAGVLCLCGNYRHASELSSGTRAWLLVWGGVFSLAVVLANYPLFSPITALMSLFNAGCAFLGGMAVGYHCLAFLARRLPLASDPAPRNRPGRVFLGVFAAVALIDLMYLYFAAYPGTLTRDSISTLEQIAAGDYNNTMPFWHTMTVRVFFQLGMGLFDDANQAAALFHTFQIFFLAACFAYGVTTLYQAGVPKPFLAGVFCVYALMPYNIAYSVTMWKDVLFAGAALLFVTALFRVLRGIGAERRNLAVLALGGIGFSLWRTNGWYAFLVTTLVMAFVLGKRYPKVVRIMAVIVLACWVLLNPLLNVLGVEGTDLIEAFSVPFQQLARVISEDRPLTQEENDLLSQAFLMDRVKELYDPNTVDPIKFQAFRHDNRDYVERNLGQYAALYLRLGLKYPGDYLKAWIDETKGYWNGGYDYWIYSKEVDMNDLGIVYVGGDSFVSRIYDAWFRYLEKPAILQPLYSIGLHVWVLAACAVLLAVKRRREALLTLPPLVIAAGLWLGSPVYAEFRYAYPIFLCLPLILGAALFGPDFEAGFGQNRGKPE